MTNMSNLIELDSNTGCTLNYLEDMEGAVMLLDDLIAEMKDCPEAAASYVAKGIITKKLLAINAALRSCLKDSQSEINSAHKIVQKLVDIDRGVKK